jgi:hypothetical protein
MLPETSWEKAPLSNAGMASNVVDRAKRSAALTVARYMNFPPYAYVFLGQLKVYHNDRAAIVKKSSPSGNKFVTAPQARPKE